MLALVKVENSRATIFGRGICQQKWNIHVQQRFGEGYVGKSGKFTISCMAYFVWELFLLHSFQPLETTFLVVLYHLHFPAKKLISSQHFLPTSKGNQTWSACTIGQK